jgi:hypothetical protein
MLQCDTMLNKTISSVPFIYSNSSSFSLDKTCVLTIHHYYKSTYVNKFMSINNRQVYSQCFNFGSIKRGIYAKVNRNMLYLR